MKTTAATAFKSRVYRRVSEAILYSDMAKEASGSQIRRLISSVTEIAWESAVQYRMIDQPSREVEDSDDLSLP